MKNYILCLVALLSIFCITGCTNKDLKKIADAFNAMEDVKTYKEQGYVLKAEALSKDLEITVGPKEGELVKLTYNLDGNILTGNIDYNDENSFYAAVISMYVIDVVGHVNGYQYGDMFQSLNDDRILEYTLEKEGLYIKFSDNHLDFKIDITKKVPLLDFSETYITTEGLNTDNLKEGSFSTRRSNVRLYTETYDGKSTITIGEKDNLTNNSYKILF